MKAILAFGGLAAAVFGGPAYAEGQPLALVGGRSISMAEATAQIVEDAVVIVRDGTISEIGSADEISIPANAEIVDASGLTLVPGLVDMHVHLWDEADLASNLAHGVTSVRNLSGMPSTLRMKARVEAGTLSGPRIFTSGPILNSPGPNAQINHQMVETAEEARAAVRWQHAAGYRRLKVYSNLRRAAYEAILDEAALLGMRITGHSPEGFRAAGVPSEKPFAIGFDEILDDGFETIEHTESIAWHGLRDRIDDASARELAGSLASAGVTVTPTLVAHGNLVRTAETKGAFAERAGIELMNPAVLATDQDNVAFWASQPAEPNRRKQAFFERFTLMMHVAGVPLVAGSDAGIFLNVPGRSLHDELALLVRAGLSPFEALRTATANAGHALGEDRLGCLEAGCLADIVALACDPLTAIDCVRRPRLVMRGGEMFDEDGIAELLAAGAVHDAAATLRDVVEALEAQGSDPSPLLELTGG